MSTELTSEPISQVAGFWRRICAFVIDSLLLGLVGMGIGACAYDALVSLGGWGRLVGFVVAVPYFGLMNSVLFNGQTLGKRILKIRVVDEYGHSLSLARSVLRAIVLSTPFFLNGAQIDVMRLPLAAGTVLSVLVFGAGLSIVYLLIFNRRNRQSLHDLTVGSFVIASAPQPQRVGSEPMSRGHWLVAAAIMLTSAVLPILLQRLSRSATFAELVAVQKAVIADPEFRHVTVKRYVTQFHGSDNSSETTRNLNVRTILVRPQPINEALADRVASILSIQGALATDVDLIQISISQGYDIGIASVWRNQSYSHSPAQWRERLETVAGVGQKVDAK